MMVSQSEYLIDFIVIVCGCSLYLLDGFFTFVFLISEFRVDYYFILFYFNGALNYYCSQ